MVSNVSRSSQRPVRQAAKRANIIIQQQQSATPYLDQTIAHQHALAELHYSTAGATAANDQTTLSANGAGVNGAIIAGHARIIVADAKRSDIVAGAGGAGGAAGNMLKPLDALHCCPLDSYPTVVVAADPYHTLNGGGAGATDDTITYRGANYVYEPSYATYYQVSWRMGVKMGRFLFSK